MKRKRLHALREVPYETSINWTLCQRHVERSQIAAFEPAVNCKQCLAVMRFRKDCEEERIARHAGEMSNA